MSVFKNSLNKVLIRLKISKWHRLKILNFIPDGNFDPMELKNFLIAALQKSGLPNWKYIYIEINKAISYQNPSLVVV